MFQEGLIVSQGPANSQGPPRDTFITCTVVYCMYVRFCLVPAYLFFVLGAFL